eukprot:gene38791-50987_t
MVNYSFQRHSLSIAHIGMLTLRALFRDLFQKRHIIEDYCERSMLAFAQPLTEYSTTEVDSSGKISPDKVKVSEVKKWKKDNVVTILQAGQVTVANFKFADLLHFIGETHIQSSE